MKEIPFDPHVMERWNVEQPETSTPEHVSEAVEAVLQIMPRRIRTKRDMNVYNAIWSRLERKTYQQIADEFKVSVSTAHGWVMAGCERAPAIASILRRPRYRWVAGT